MRVGKLNWDDLQYIIDNHRGKIRKEVAVSNGVGEDCAVINFGNSQCIVSTDPITGATSNIGKLAVNINCNDIASCGVEPLGILVTILAPPSTDLEDLHKLMKEIHEEASKINVQIIGGHTEVTEAVNRMVVSCTAIGKGGRDSAISTAGARVDDFVVVTKKLCLEGTSILAQEYEEELLEVLSKEEIEEAKAYVDSISVVKDGIVGGRCDVSSMHDITEGGILGALWEVATASGVGFEVEMEKMPISSITNKVCCHLGIDPLRLISSGSMLITTNNPEKLLIALKGEGIEATIVGRITKDRGILIQNGVSLEVEPPESDELFNIDK